MNVKRNFVKACVIPLVFLGLSSQVMGQEKFPSKPIKLVVTFGAGGSGDLMARALAQKMGEILGQPVVVENRPGASGVPGTDFVAKSPADGYTILQYTSTLAVNMVLQPGLSYDLLRDFIPISYSFESPLVLLTHGASPHRRIPELVDYAKASSKGISFGHGGVGTIGHLSGELFKRSMNIDAVSVAYKGNGPAMNDLLGGRLDYFFSTVVEMLPNIKAGKLNALAVTTASRDPLLPEVPTMVELGYKDFTPVASWGYMVPRGTPEAHVKRLQEAIAKAIATPSMTEMLRTVGASASNSGGGDVMTAKIRGEIARWKPIIAAANIKAD